MTLGVKVVAGGKNEIGRTVLADEGHGALERVGHTQPLLLVGQPDPTGPHRPAEMLDESAVVGVGDDDEAVSAAPRQHLQHPLDHRFAGDGQRGLGALLGEGTQPFPAPCSQHDRQDGRLVEWYEPIIVHRSLVHCSLVHCSLLIVCRSPSRSTCARHTRAFFNPAPSAAARSASTSSSS